MPYLNIDLEYLTHRKTVRLVGLLGNGAELLPIRLWAYCGKHHPESGNLRDYSTQEIESLVGWWGKPGACVDALLKVAFLDQGADGLVVHEWKDHQGHISAFSERGRKANKARWDRIRAESNDESRSPSGIPKPESKESPNPTKPNQTNHNKSEVNSILPSGSKNPDGKAERRKVNQAAWTEVYQAVSEILGPSDAQAIVERYRKEYPDCPESIHRKVIGWSIEAKKNSTDAVKCKYVFKCEKEPSDWALDEYAKIIARLRGAA